MMRADFFGQQQGDVMTPVREVYDGVLIGNMGYSAAEASAAIDAGLLDATSPSGPVFWPIPICRSVFVRARRSMRQIRPLFYSPGPVGYTDYPTLGAA